MNLAKEKFSHIHHWYEENRVSLVRMAVMLGHQNDEADDFVNQFFLDLLEKNIDPDLVTNPQAFLSTAFRRKLIDHYRRSKAKAKMYVVGGEINDRLSEPSAQEAIEQTQDNTELVNQIRKAFLKLPDRCQKVMYLKFYKGLSTEQIALQTGLTKRSVYNNLFEGIKILRAGMSQLAPGIQYAAIISVFPLLILNL